MDVTDVSPEVMDFAPPAPGAAPPPVAAPAVVTAVAPVPPSTDELAAALGASPAAPAEPAAAIAAPKPAIRWLGDKPRSATYELLFPFALDDVEIRAITIRRVTAGEVSGYLDAMRANPAGPHRFPAYYMADGVTPVSEAIWDALDDDDRFALGEMLAGFLPARFRSAPAADPEADAKS